MGTLQDQVEGARTMAVKERKRWKQESEDAIRDFIYQAYNRDAGNPCPVDRLKVFSDHMRRSSCGECVICREGTLQLYTITEAITQGSGRDGDFGIVREIAEDMAAGSSCDFGKEVGRLAKSIIENEGEQFEKHIKRKRCDTLICKKFFTYYISPEKCTGCNQCVEACKPGAITGKPGWIHIIDSAVCNRCGECVLACEAGSIQKAGTVLPKLPDEPMPVGSFQPNEGGLLSQKRRRRSEE